jgi:protein TonB
MFEPLIESSGRARRRAGGTVLSLVVHAMVVAGAVHATERVVKGAAMGHTDTLTFVLAAPRKASEEVNVEEQPIPAAPTDVGEMIPAAIPTVDIPAVDLSSKPFDVTAVVGKQSPAGLPALSAATGAAPGASGVFVSAQVDEPVVALSQPVPKYPAAMEEAGVGGHVEFEFVVDSAGHVEPGSLKLLTATHAGFVEPAREAILGGVYRAARYRGVAVRQLVRQRVAFQGG